MVVHFNGDIPAAIQSNLEVGQIIRNTAFGDHERVALKSDGHTEGVEIKKHKDENGKPLDGIAFHPYYSVKDIFGVGMFLLIFLFIVFVKPDLGGLFLEHDNYVPANPAATQFLAI